MPGYDPPRGCCRQAPAQAFRFRWHAVDPAFRRVIGPLVHDGQVVVQFEVFAAELPGKNRQTVPLPTAIDSGLSRHFVVQYEMTSGRTQGASLTLGTVLLWKPSARLQPANRTITALHKDLSS